MVPIADRHNEYAQKVAKQLREAGLRVQVDDSRDRMNAKIRKHTKQKTPFILVVGDNEVEAGLVAPRARDFENLEPMTIGDFAEFAKENM